MTGPGPRSASSPAGRARGGRPCHLHGEAGVSAVEFALFAPVLFFAVAAMLDIGLAAYERMTMDRLLRGGAQAAMADPGQAQVEAVIRASAEDDFAPDSEFNLDVDRYCACPANIDTPLGSCTSLCTGNVPPHIFYRMEASRSYPGIILPEIDLHTEAKVQIR